MSNELFLSIDTSNDYISAALADFSGIIDYKEFFTDGKKSEIILELINDLFKDNNVKISDVSVFSSSIGPGSFTGIRVGVSTLKGMVFRKNINCIGISSLEALAFQNKDVKSVSAPFVVLRNSSVYSSLYLFENDDFNVVSQIKSYSFEDFIKYVESNKDKCVFIGNKTIIDNSNCFINDYVNAKGVALASIYYYNKGFKSTDMDLKPSYYAISQAENDYKK